MKAIDAALTRIQVGLDAGWRPELSYNLTSGWRCHIVNVSDPCTCTKTTHGGTPHAALLKMEQFVRVKNGRS